MRRVLVIDDHEPSRKNLFRVLAESGFEVAGDGTITMARSREKSATGKIFENILFLAEVFGDKGSGEIPNVPVLELARCFELKGADPKQVGRRRRKRGLRWQ